MKQSLKGLLTAIAGLMMFLPWTILILRQYEWALQSPAAERSEEHTSELQSQR